VVTVDDCSIDGSRETVESLASPLATASALDVHGRRRDRSDTGLDCAEGRYSRFFDADAVGHADAFVEAVLLLDRSGGDAAMTSRYHQADAGAPATVVVAPEVKIGMSTSDRHTVHVEAPDMPGCWGALLLADRLLLVDGRLCMHVVPVGRRNPTNRKSPVRLALFDAPAETNARLLADRRRMYSDAYCCFAMNAANWANDRTSASHLQEFRLRFQERLVDIDVSDRPHTADQSGLPKRDDRVVPVLRPRTRSVGAMAVNLGLDRAMGTWLGTMDGDDSASLPVLSNNGSYTTNL
jgi:glycosyltransferase involved in cell wall biosynthesis